MCVTIMSRSAKIPVPINDGLPVKYLALLATDLKARILERLEPGQEWAGLSIHLGVHGRWCFRFNGNIRREWYGQSFEEALAKLTNWLELG